MPRKEHGGEDDGDALPITSADLAAGIFVTGSSANHTVADPTSEASTPGFIGRDAIDPVQQLKGFSGDPEERVHLRSRDRPGRDHGPTITPATTAQAVPTSEV